VGINNVQVATFGTYEFAASRYELLYGLQGANGVADPGLLGTFLDAPIAYSSAGRQAFRRQRHQAIKNAAQIAGRRQSSGGKSSRIDSPYTEFPSGRPASSATSRGSSVNGGGGWRGLAVAPSRTRRIYHQLNMLPPLFVAVGLAHHSWTEIGPSDWFASCASGTSFRGSASHPSRAGSRRSIFSPADLGSNAERCCGG
jgi:hypothetical protein